MKLLVTCLLSAVLLISPLASAGPKSVYYDYGRVVKVKPVFHKGHHSHQVQNCYRSSHGHHYGSTNKNKVLPTVTGAIVGGAIGNTLARNSSKRGLATVTGAVVGGVIGNEIAQNQSGYQAHKRRHHHVHDCVAVQEHGGKRLKGYRVTYRYKGEKFTTFTRRHPGGRIKLEVSVRPAVYR